MSLVRHLEVAHVKRTRTTTGFDEHLGFVHLTHLHTEGFPLLEVSCDVDMTALTGTLTLAEVLREGRITLDRGGIVTLVLVNFVGGTINLEFTLLLAKEVRTRLAEPVINDVVFYERINRPA